MTALQKSIAKIYWRNIKNGNRTFASITDEVVAEEVKRLAALDVQDGEITAERYEELIGEEYKETTGETGTEE